MTEPALCMNAVTLLCGSLLGAPSANIESASIEPASIESASIESASVESTSIEPSDVRPRASHNSAPGDGVYGRFEGDVETALAAGGGLHGSQPSLQLRASAHYFSTAGLWVGSGFDLDAPDGQQASSLAFGVDLKPAFLPRFSQDMQQGPAMLDLLLDSISLSLGPYFRLGEGAANAAEGARGLELSLGTGVPLSRSLSGLWIDARAVVRVPDGPQRVAFGGLLLLSWRTSFSTPLTD